MNRFVFLFVYLFIYLFFLSKMKSTFERLARGGRLLVVRPIHYCFWRLFFRPFFVTGFDGAYFSAQNGFFLGMIIFIRGIFLQIS